ncbi:MAG TPA: hypothetical protein VMY18_03390 [Acidobacteriota bacterium]|nr:hypothetical protein [Acidobacteriota bacterium]
MSRVSLGKRASVELRSPFGIMIVSRSVGWITIGELGRILK